MPVDLRAAGAVATANATSIALQAPASVQLGDVLVALIGNRGGSYTGPAGWTQQPPDPFAQDATWFAYFVVFTKIAAAADVTASGAGSTYTFSNGGFTLPMVGRILAYSGGSPTSPLIGYAEDTSTASYVTSLAVGTVATPAVTGYRTITGWVATYPSGAGPTITPGSGTDRGGGTSGEVTLKLIDDTSDPSSDRSATISVASLAAGVMLVLGPRYWEPPNAPALVTPIGGATIVRTVNNTFRWAPSFVDTDTQTLAQMRYRAYPGAGAWTTVSVTGSTASNVITANTLAAGDYEWQARVAGAHGVYGEWSASEFFTAVDPPDAPVIETPGDGDVIAENTADVTIAGDPFDSWQARAVADTAGVPDTATVYEDTGEIDVTDGTVTATTTLDFATTGRFEHVQARIKIDGIWSDWASARVEVDYTPPEQPTIDVLEDTPAGAITIDITNPVVLMSEAVAWWSAADYNGSGDVLDKSPNGHDLTNTGATFLDEDATVDPYIYLPRVVENHLSIPDSVALSITGDLEARIRVAVDDYTAAGDVQSLISKWDGPTNQRSFIFSLTSAGKLNWEWSADGSASTLKESSVAVGVTDGDTIWFGITHDVDNDAAGNDVKFWKSTVTNPGAVGGGDWTQIGTTQTTAGTTSIFDSTVPVFIGETGVTSNFWPLGGKFYRALLYNGIGGTAVLDLPASNATVTGSTFAATTGGTVTIVRPSSGKKLAVVDHDLFLLGTDDHLEAADHADLDLTDDADFTHAAVVRVNGTPSGTIAAKKTSAAAGTVGWMLELVAGVPTARIADGTTLVTATGPGGTALTAGDHVIAVRLRHGQDLTVYVDGVAGTPVADTTSGTLANSEVFRIGRLSGAGTGYLDGVWTSSIHFADALDASDIADITAAALEEPRVPPATENRVWRRALDENGDPIDDTDIRVAVDVAVNGTWEDWHTGHLERVSYAVEAVGGGTSTFSEWSD